MPSGTAARSITAALRRQHVLEVSARVMERWVATRPKGTVQIARLLHTTSSDRGTASATHADRIAVQDARLWFEPPSRWRYEVDFDGRTAVYVRNGPLWWSYAPGSHAWSNESAPERSPAQAEHQDAELFDPDAVLAALSVTSTREERRAGRAVEVVEATLRENGFVPSMPPGADAYHIVIDRERGVVLRMAALADGAEFASVEITSLELDAPIDPSMFHIELPSGVAFSPPPDHARHRRGWRHALGSLLPTIGRPRR